MAFNKTTASKAGSKSKRGTAILTKQIREFIINKDAEQVVNNLKEMALKGDNIKAIELYLAYAFGRPTFQIDIEASKQFLPTVINIIENNSGN